MPAPGDGGEGGEGEGADEEEDDDDRHLLVTPLCLLFCQPLASRAVTLTGRIN